MKQVYPVFIAEHENDYLVYVPDMDIYTEGKTMADAIEMARDAIGLKGIDFEDDGKEFPIPSTREAAIAKAKEDAEIFDYSTGILTLVDVNFTEYRRKVDNKAVRRNVTLPNWLNAEAEKAQVNVSKVLQEALISTLGVTKKY
ncbi:MAG: type II toxin-antitoxin system HicB family antitoxin [Tyzzerella sp.]|nr:type II toxin-antitoxin system HicB family antitoxin [Tyzzerella sp.]